MPLNGTKPMPKKEALSFCLLLKSGKLGGKPRAIGILEGLAKTNTVCAEIMMQARMLYGMFIVLQTVKI